MSKRTLYIIICLLLLLDVAAFVIYILGNSNRDGKSPIEMRMRDSIDVEMADTIPDALVEDRFDTISREVNYVSLDKVSDGVEEKRMSTTIKLKLVWPESINHNSSLKQLESALMEKLLGRAYETVDQAIDSLISHPKFVQYSSNFSKVESSLVEEKGNHHTKQLYRVFPYFRTHYLMEFYVLIEKYDGHKRRRKVGVVHYDRLHNKVISMDEIFDLSHSKDILALVNQNIERVKIDKKNNKIHETSTLPMEFLLGTKSVIFYLPDGAIAPIGTGVYEVSVRNADLMEYFTSYYNELLNNDSLFSSYGFLTW